VTHRPERSFLVECGDVSVEVLGTAFELNRTGDRTHVRVLRGLVAVHWPGGTTKLPAGESDWFPRAPDAHATDAVAPAIRETGRRGADQHVPLAAAGARDAARRGADANAAARRERARLESGATRRGAPERQALEATNTRDAAQRGRPETEAADGPDAAQRGAAERQAHAEGSRKQTSQDASWQAQAERGDYRSAYDLLQQTSERVSDDVEELLLAADAARLSGHPAEALPFLRRVSERHPRDPRASLAAFTLAGVLLNQLDRPLEAEAAYAQARSLTLSPALAQDALARQVEAASRGQDSAHARDLAEEYLRRYPNGRRVQWVRELGGL
jgi:transmembrane sensor